MARVGGLEVLAPAHDYAHRAPRLARQGHRRGLHGGRQLAAEAAADLGGDDPDLGHGHPQDLRDGGAQRELGLGGRPHSGLARGVEAGRGGVRFDVGLVHHGHVETVLEDPVGLREPACHVAAHDLLVAAHVAAPVQVRLRPVVGVVFVQQRRVRRHGLQPGSDRGQHLIVHLDEPRRFLGGLLVHRRHRGDAVAGIARLGGGEVRLVAHEAAVADVRKVGGRHHRLDARQPLGALGADGGDARVGVRAQHHLAGKHSVAGQDVRAEHRLPGDLLQNLDPGKLLTDDSHDSFAASMTAWMMVP